MTAVGRYVKLTAREGSGHALAQVMLQVREVDARDAIRIAPESMRAFEAGPDGLELVAVGRHHSGNSELLSDFWPADS